MNKKYFENKDIILKLALVLNKELFDSNKISFKLFKYTNEEILKKLNMSDVA